MKNIIAEKKRSMLKKIISMLIAMSLFSGYISFIPQASAYFADIYGYGSHQIYYSVTASTETNAGSISNLYMIVTFDDGTSTSHTIGKIGKGNTAAGYATIGRQPWEITSIALTVTGIDSLSVYKFDACACDVWGYPSEAALSYTTGNSGDGWWLGNGSSKTWYSWSNYSFSRTVSSLGNLNDFSDTVYLDGSAYTEQFYWNGLISDQYAQNYAPFSTIDVPTTSIGVYGIGTNGAVYNDISAFGYRFANNLSYNGLVQIDYGGLYEEMVNKGIYKLDVTLNFTFKDNVNSSATKNYSTTKTFVRTDIALGNVASITYPDKITTYQDSVSSGNINFYNGNSSKISMSVEILDSSNSSSNLTHYTATDLSSNIMSAYNSGLNSLDDVRLYYSTDPSVYVTATGVGQIYEDVQITETSWSWFTGFTTSTKTENVCDTLYFEFPVPAEFNGDGAGLSVQIDNMQATDSRFSCKTFSSNYISDYQIDTKGVDIQIVGSDFSDYKQTQYFTIDTAGDDPYFSNLQDYFSYRLRASDGSEISGASSERFSVNGNVPYSETTTYDISKKGDEGTFELAVYVYDEAANYTGDWQQINLDYLAPRVYVSRNDAVSYDEQVKRSEYTFDITDITGNSKVYYCLLVDGETLPNPSESAPPVTGEISTLLNTWMYVPQDGETTTIVYGEEIGDNNEFNGTLYYYAVDGAGNDTRTSAVEGDSNNNRTGDGYYTIDASLDASPGEADLVAQAYTWAQSRYDISFENISENTTVDYRWVQGNVSSPWTAYTGSSDVGTPYQSLASGYSPMDGTWTLEYRMTKTLDGISTYSYGSESFIFDNSAPSLTVTTGNAAVEPTETLSYYISDISQIVSATFQLVDENGDPMEGEEIVTINPMLNSKSGTIVASPKLSGAYRMKVIATDINGYSTEYTTGFFSVRVQAPEITAVSLVDSRDDDVKAVYKLINWSETAMICVDVFEPLVNAEYFDLTGSAMQYRQLDSNGNYISTSWLKDSLSTIKLNEEGTGLEGSAYFTSLKYTNGINPINVEIITGIYSTSELIASSNGQAAFYVDYTSPYYRIATNSYRTFGSSDFTLYLSDNYTAIEDLEIDWNNKSYLTISEDVVYDETLGYGYVFTATKNGDYDFTVEDEAGNVTSFPVSISTVAEMNMEASYWESYDPSEYDDIGDRTDAVISGYLSGVIADSVLFKVVENGIDIDAENYAQVDALSGVTIDIDSSINSTNYLRVSDADYDLYVYATSELSDPNKTYDLVVYALDDLDQIFCKTVVENFKLVGADLETVEYSGVLTNQVGSAVPVSVTANVPAYIISEDDIDSVTSNEEEAIEKLQLLAMSTDLYSTTYTFILREEEINDTHTFYAIDKNGNYGKYDIKVTDEVIFNDVSSLGVIEEVYSGGYDYDVGEYVFDGDPVDPSSIMAVGWGAEHTVRVTNDAALTGTIPVEVQTMQAVPTEEIIADDTVTDETEQAEVEIASLTGEDDANAETNTSEEPDTNAEPDEAIDVSTDVVVDNDVSTDVEVDTNTEVSTETDTEEETVKYVTTTETVYYPIQFFTIEDASGDSCGSGFDFTSFYNDYTQGLWEEIERAYSELNVEARNYPQQYNKYFYYNVYTLKTDAQGDYLDPTDINNYEVTYMCYDITVYDVTGPVSVSSVSDNTPKADGESVYVQFTSYDEEAKGYGTDDASNGTGLMGAEISYLVGSNYDWDVETLDISEAEEIDTSSGHEVGKLYYNTELGALQYTAEMTANGIISFTARNNFGLYDENEASYVDISNFYEAQPITKGQDYDITYTDESGEAIDVNGYYGTIIATVEFTQAGEERGLLVSNNGGNNFVLLTQQMKTFTFEFIDNNGLTGETEVSFANFDTTAPTFTYSYSTDPTNTSVELTVTATDDYSGISSVAVSDPEGNPLEVTDVGSGNYTATMTQSGIYTVVVTDKAGYVTSSSLIVENIDASPIEATWTYNVDPNLNTSQEVLVQLAYNKDDVFMSSVKGNEAFEDFTYVTSSNIIRFSENGSVDVSLMDIYGNTATVTITVDNINDVPPNVVPVITNNNGDVVDVSNGEYGSNVHFEQNPAHDESVDGTLTDITDLMVLYSGILRPVAYYSVDKEGNYLDETGEIVLLEEDAEIIYTEFSFIKSGDYYFLVYDNAGNYQALCATVALDTTAPVITSVSWSYDYYLADDNFETANPYSKEIQIGVDTSGTEVGYNVATDIYPATNQDVTVTVTTDSETKQVGSGSDTYSTEHTLTYTENGLYNFNLEKENQYYDSYAVGIYLIDKVAPIIADSETGEDLEDLMFYANPDAGEAFTASALYDYIAYDLQVGLDSVLLTSSVEISVTDYQGNVVTVQDMVDLSLTDYDKNKAYTVTYTVYDEVGNKTIATRTVTFVGLMDCLVLVNGQFPDSSNRIIVDGNSATLSVFNGTNAYARYASGSYTMGQMKKLTTSQGVKTISSTNSDYKTFTVSNLSSGWYTFYIQTTTAEYFTIKVYINN